MQEHAVDGSVLGRGRGSTPKQRATSEAGRNRGCPDPPPEHRPIGGGRSFLFVKKSSTQDISLVLVGSLAALERAD